MFNVNERGFIPGIWEEEISVNDFLNLNRNQWKEGYSAVDSGFKISSVYNAVRDDEKNFRYIKPFREEDTLMYDYGYERFISEEEYEYFTDTVDRKKFIDIGLIVKATNEERKAFLQPDLCVVPLYGTKFLIKTLKQYIKDLDKQFQTQEWIHRKIGSYRSIEAIQKFEEFALQQGINVRKPCKNALEVINIIWLEALYCQMEDGKVSFAFHNIFDFLDIYIEKDLKSGILNEIKAQRLVEELYCKLGAIRSKGKIKNTFSYGIIIDGTKLNNTTFRLLKSIQNHKEFILPLQIIISETVLPKKLITHLEVIFQTGHPISLSKILKDEYRNNVALTSTQLSFRNFEDVPMNFGSFDLKKGLIVALNGGRDVNKKTAIQQVTKALRVDCELVYEKVWNQLEVFLKYYITAYVEYSNLCAYYFDMFHNLPFRNALVSSYPYYLINLAFHNIEELLKILFSIKEQQIKIVKDEKGYIKDIIPLVNGYDLNILNNLQLHINEEVDRMLFYKNGHFKVTLFEKEPFFTNRSEVGEETSEIPNYIDLNLYRERKIKVNELEIYINKFKDSLYSCVRLYRC